MNITEYTVEEIIDPTGILTGNRYEFMLNIEVPEDDELYDVKWITIKSALLC